METRKCVLTDDEGILGRTGGWGVCQSEEICSKVEDVADDHVVDCDDGERHQGARD